MNRDSIQPLIGSAIAVCIAAGLAWAGSQHSITVLHDIPLFAVCILIAFAIQWIAFIPSYVAKTEKYYDIVGSFTYTTVILSALIITSRYDSQSILLTGLVLIWTFRLGFYLFRRILRTGRDRRFNEIKKSAGRFFLHGHCRGCGSVLQQLRHWRPLLIKMMLNLVLLALLACVYGLLDLALRRLPIFRKANLLKIPQTGIGL